MFNQNQLPDINEPRFQFLNEATSEEVNMMGFLTALALIQIGGAHVLRESRSATQIEMVVEMYDAQIIILERPIFSPEIEEQMAQAVQKLIAMQSETHSDSDALPFVHSLN